MFNRRSKKRVARMAVRSAGFAGPVHEVVQKDHLVSVIVSASSKFDNEVPDLADAESMEQLSESIYSAQITLTSASKISKMSSVRSVQTKKKKLLHLDRATMGIELRSTVSGPRQVSETGKGVLIGIIDTGFDLSHPMFRTDAGKLRVKALLDQTQASNPEFTTSQLEKQWTGVANPDGPGSDADGHGTHVATIAGGTKFKGFEGVARDAKFLLVKTDFINTDKAVSWIFKQAGSTPCVINMSLGHHWGAHDGSEQEERLHETLTGPGKIIVVSAGNERSDHIHIGGRFVKNQVESVPFRILRPQDGSAPFVAFTLWYNELDEFDFELTTPTGDVLDVPNPGSAANFSSSQLDIEAAHVSGSGADGTSGKVQVTIELNSSSAPNSLLNGWSIKMRCETAIIGRVDGWLNNSGFGEFGPHPFVEETRTLGLPASGNGCISVASHVSRNSWDSDAGDQEDTTILPGRTSPFSSQGPTRDGRQKPEISAPGQYLVAGLARNSSLASVQERALESRRLVAIEGTSMSAPMVTGAIALLLQKKPGLTRQQAIDAMQASAITDGHTGPVWNPAYGHGKLDVKAAIDSL